MYNSDEYIIYYILYMYNSDVYVYIIYVLTVMYIYYIYVYILYICTYIIVINEMSITSSHTPNDANVIETLELKLTCSTDELYQANMRLITLEEEIRLLKGNKSVMNRNEKSSVTWSDKLSHPEEEDFNSNNNNVTLLDDEFRVEFENMKQQLYNSNMTIEKLQNELKMMSQMNNSNINNSSDMDVIFTSSTRNHNKYLNINTTTTTTKNNNDNKNNKNNSHNYQRNDHIYNDIENH